MVQQPTPSRLVEVEENNGRTENTTGTEQTSPADGVHDATPATHSTVVPLEERDIAGDLVAQGYQRSREGSPDFHVATDILALGASQFGRWTIHEYSAQHCAALESNQCATTVLSSSSALFSAVETQGSPT